MIFILLACLSGCTSTRIISKSDLPLPDSNRYSRYPYVVHCEEYSFLLEKPTISNGILSGTLNQVDKSRHPKEKIHLYLLSDSMIKIDEKKILSVPIDEVKEVEVQRPAAAKTILLVTGCVVGLGASVLLIYGVGYAIYVLLTLPA
jgi:hypothetical protein